MPCWQVHKIICEEDGVLYKEEQAIIPVSQFPSSEIKEKLHAAHLDYESMIRRTRTTAFWPGIQHLLKQVAGGPTRQLITDCGSKFLAVEFQNFLKNCESITRHHLLTTIKAMIKLKQL